MINLTNAPKTLWCLSLLACFAVFSAIPTQGQQEVARPDRITGHVGPVEELAFSLDGNALLSTGWDDNGIKYWLVDGATFKPFATLSSGAQPAIAVALNRDGTYVAVPSSNRKQITFAKKANKGLDLLKWTIDVRYDKERGSIPPCPICFSTDSKWIAVASLNDAFVDIWPIPLGPGDRVRRLSGCNLAVDKFAFSKDSARLAAAGDGDIIAIWELLPEQKSPRIIREKNMGHCFDIRFSDTGHQLAVCYWINYRTAFAVLRIDTRTGAKTKTTFANSGKGEKINAAAFTSDIGSIVTGDDRGNICEWSVATAKKTYSLEIAEEPRSVATSPKGDIVVIGSEAGSLYLLRRPKVENRKLEENGGK